MKTLLTGYGFICSETHAAFIKNRSVKSFLETRALEHSKDAESVSQGIGFIVLENDRYFVYEQKTLTKRILDKELLVLPIETGFSESKTILAIANHLVIDFDDVKWFNLVIEEESS